MRIWPCLLLAALLSPPASGAGELPARQKELTQVQARLKTLRVRLKDDQGRQDELQQQLQALETRVADQQLQLRQLQDQAARQQRKVEDTRVVQQRAEESLRQQRSALGQQLRAAHAVGRSGQLKLLLNQEDVQKVGRVLAYYDYLNRARGERIRGILGQMEMIREIGQKLEAELGEFTALRTQQEQALAELGGTRAQRLETVQRLAERIAGAADEIRVLEADERRLESLLDQLRQALADIPPDAGSDRPLQQRRGKLPWPLRGKLLARYGQAKGGGQFNWRGIWIEAAEGAPVRAVARGRIAYAGWMQRYGLIVILEHPGGYYTLYGHLQRVPRAEGEWVDAGAVLAQAGNTGGHDRSGLYFELRKGREPQNPAQWLTPP